MDLKLKNLESILDHNADYPDNLILPPLWQVIYQEGIRGHHLLFTSHDLATFEANLDDSPLSIDHAKAIEETVVGILSSTNLSDMRTLIANLDELTRRKVFGFYRYLLAYWSKELKINLS